VKETFQHEVMKILGISEKEASPLTLDQESSLYNRAYGLYEKEDYRAASQLFTQLVLTDPFSKEYWQGLAGSRQMSREYLAAVHAWGLAALLDEADPLPHFHAAECLLCMEEKEEALKALDAALACCDDSSLQEKINRVKQIHYDTN
jgi:type III secretion system low calcium response chaperone LcrH/SycD